MALPVPHPGLVISYSYLWAEEHDRGREEGVKDRPCAVVIARRVAEDKTIVTVVPVTHAPPADPKAALEIPPALKAHLGLDTQRSWIVLSEYNEFLWPGPDVRPVASGADSFSYGVLPPGFFRQMRERLLSLIEARRVQHVRRTE
ncbi:hypothetical protein WG908_04455 [Sphingobium sp. AN641]|uniref:hypothetical protein n=1 Tax=Sphingobium sp. AN641 TaxID=3133443 RepID=UPI0030BFA846